MKVAVALLLLCAALVSGPARAAGPALPQRDLTVELRQVEEGREEGGGHYSAGGADNSLWEPQMVQVRNGEKGVLRMNDAIPMQWTQSVSGATPSGGAGTALPSTGSASTSNVNINAASGVSKALVWFDAGQSLSVQPKWPGGKHPAVLEIEMQRAAVDPNTGAELPRQTRNTVSTTITAPLAEWVTVAATGRSARAGGYSSEAAVHVRRLLQIRVLAP
jgi:hypothetical protein